MVYGKNEEKLLQNNMDLQAYYLNVYAIIYFKFKLQLKLRNNKNYSNIVVNFHTGLS
jgi:hypothetical protein